MHALEVSTPTAPSTKTIVAFRHLPLAKVDFAPFVDNFHLKTDLGLDREIVIFVLTHSPHLSFSGPLGMVYELL